MPKLVRLAFFACLLASCSHPQVVLHGKQVTIAEGNIAFTLPDSSFIYSKPILWPADYSNGEYGEAGAFYHNQDSAISISAYVTAYPDTLQNSAPWRSIADEKVQRETILVKNCGLAVVESYKADSASHTIEIDYHLPKRHEKDWRGQASYEKSLTIYGRHRTIKFWLFGPDNPTSHQQFAAIQASIQVNPAYLLATVAPHQSRAFQD